jgi:hypothetical protein
VRDVAFLHHQLFFAAAQKKYGLFVDIIVCSIKTSLAEHSHGKSI